MHLNPRARRAQAALDMFISYGVVILVISIALYVVLQLGIFNTRLAPTYCNAAPSFICAGVAIVPSGNMTIIFSQATGGTLNITGAACATEANTVQNGPKYGNFNVLPYTYVPARQYYPTSQFQNGVVVYSSNQTRINVNCYNGGNIAKGALGNAFTGYVWINYTINTLPSNYHTVQQVISMSTHYT